MKEALAEMEGAKPVWVWIAAIKGEDSAAAERALNFICAHYWPKLCGHACRCGWAQEEAEDITQNFLTRAIERGFWRLADESRGSLDGFVMASFRCHVADHTRWLRRHAISPEALRQRLVAAGRELPVEAPDSSERHCDQQAAKKLVGQVMHKLRQETGGLKQAMAFDLLAPHLLGGPAARPHEEIAEQLGIAKTSVKVNVHRLRQRFLEMLRSEIRRILAPGEDVEVEMKYLLVLCSAAVA